MIQMLQKETATVRLARDYIVCSFLWNGTTKDSLILMDYLYSIHPRRSLRSYRRYYKSRSYRTLENEVEGLKDDQDG